MNYYENELKITLESFPKFKLMPKHKSTLMRFMSYLLFFNKGFMSNFVTTIGNYIWVPENWDKLDNKVKATVIRHERVHLIQQKRYGMFLYIILYLFWPIPIFFALGRRNIEMEAYAESLRAEAEYFGLFFIDQPKNMDRYVSYFTSSSYAWMWINRNSIENWYKQIVTEIKQGRV